MTWRDFKFSNKQAKQARGQGEEEKAASAYLKMSK